MGTCAVTDAFSPPTDGGGGGRPFTQTRQLGAIAFKVRIGKRLHLPDQVPHLAEYGSETQERKRGSRPDSRKSPASSSWTRASLPPFRSATPTERTTAIPGECPDNGPRFPGQS